MKTNRREFLLLTTISPLALNSLLKAQSSEPIKSTQTTNRIAVEVKIDELAPVPESLNNEFKKLVKWMSQTGWTDYLNRNFGIKLGSESWKLDNSLFSLIDNPAHPSGFEDFGGKRLIEPGDPAMSLLYYALASASVTPSRLGTKPEIDQIYPSLYQLDVLENYIYSLKPINKVEINPQTFVLATFSYEFRSATKTTHRQHSDFVFSRTGIARVGEEAMNYDSPNRCFTNEPLTTDKKKIAVTPARYGLFLAKKVKYNELALMTQESKDDDYKREFLLPIRKVFNEDFLLGGTTFKYTENHRNEKLYRLVTDGAEIEKKIVFDKELFKSNEPPFQRISCTSSKGENYNGHNSLMVNFTEFGSSVCLNSIPQDLVREAYQDSKRIRIKIPPKDNYLIGLESNRRYGALKLQGEKFDNTLDYILTEGVSKKTRSTRFSAPRNSPLFVNIKNKVSEDGKETDFLSIQNEEEFKKNLNSKYWVGLFEDSICDGCVTVEIDTTKINSSAPGLPVEFLLNPLPAFSLVTAPDFFQFVDSGDILKFDNNKDGKYESSFLQGGVERLSTSRKRPNPKITLPNSKIKTPAFPNVFESKIRNQNSKTCEADVKSCVYDTVTAVISSFSEKGFTKDKQSKSIRKTSFLPDTASFVFAPGWDVTYSGGDSGEENGIFLATHGLGSPFVEDTKLCAAANGMWAAASPDSSRTFYGSLEPINTGLLSSRRPPTSIPLLDNELGFHEESCAVKEYGSSPTTGWDGECGPFLCREDNKISVNFTDIVKADYVQNVKAGKFDMSLLRDLTTEQLIFRMSALKQSVEKIESSIVAYSKLWLVSAEKVEDWASGAKGLGIPNTLFGSNKAWATYPQSQMSGSGFLFVFAEISKGKPQPDTKRIDPKRLKQECKKVYVSQIGRQNEEYFVKFCVLESKTKTLRWK